MSEHIDISSDRRLEYIVLVKAESLLMRANWHGCHVLDRFDVMTGRNMRNMIFLFVHTKQGWNATNTHYNG